MVNPVAVRALPEMLRRINDNHCKVPPEVTSCPEFGVVNVTKTSLPVLVKDSVNCHNVVHHVLSVKNIRQPQKKGISPILNSQNTIKYVKSASFVNHCVFAPSVSNVLSVANVQSVGGRLQNFWKIWALKGANPKVVSILKKGYVLPFKVRPPLIREPLIVSGYANPTRDSHLQEAVQALIKKKAVERVRVRTSLAFFNRLFIVPKPNQKWRPILDLSTLNQFLCVKTFKMETPETIRTSLQQGEWVSSIDFSDAYFHIPIHFTSRKFLRFHFQFRALPFGLSTAPMEFTAVVKEVKLMAQSRGIRIHQYLDDWLIRAPTKESCHQGTQSLLALCQELGWMVNMQKSELEPQQVFDFVGYQYDLLNGLVRPTQNRWEALQQKITGLLQRRSCQVRTFMSLIGLLTATEKQVTLGRLHMRPIQWHLKKHWRVPESLEKEIPIPRSPSAPAVVDPGVKGPKGSTLTPPTTRNTNLYRCLKRRLGCSLRRLHSKRDLVSARKQITHKLLRAKSRVVSTKKIPTLSARKGRPDCHRQHHSCGIHQQGGRYEVRFTLCPSLAAPMLVQSQTNSTEGQTYSGPSECNCRQVVSPGTGHSDRVVPPSGDLRHPLSNLALSPSGHVCNKVQLQTSPVCVPNSRPEGLVSGRSDAVLGKPGHVPLSPSVSDGEGGQQAVRPLVSQSNPDCSGMAKHALVLGPSGAVGHGSSLSSTPSRSSDPTFQQGTSQGSDKLKSPCLAPRAQTIKEQGFSSPVAARIEAPQRRSTRAVYEAKWALFVRWCETSQVDFRNPSIKQIADFLLHLFQEKNLQPSTIDGYRSAISDKLGNASVNVGKDDNLTRLLDSFHRDRPKGRRGVPAWNLSLVLHQLTKAPFEPLRKASLKHLTFKTVFLLALASGKRRSEIHAWLNKNIRHQADWSKVSLYPSPSFLAKNHLAKEGPECVAPVVIPALAPTLDKSLQEDRSLCPVRALRYYLDKTQDLRTGKELVFVSFKQGFNKDISPATISSWIKQTVVLCYDLSDQDTLTLHQVKAHDVRAFAASKAFQGGISLDQILAACHWKSHNTFTQFYLKDVAWADKELFHLGPVVAAQQIHH